MLVATVPVVAGGTSEDVGTATGYTHSEAFESMEDDSTLNLPKPYIPKPSGSGCYGAYEIWAVDEDDPTQPVVIAEGKKVLVGLGLFENIEGNYGLPDGLGIDYGPLRDFTLDAILHVSDNPNPRVALYDPDPLAEGDAGWNEINAKSWQWPTLDDWTINPFETDSYETVVDEWEAAGSIAMGAQIERFDELYTLAGDLAYDVLILDQGGQANTPDYDTKINTIQTYLDDGGAVIISAYAFIDWASFFELYEKPGVQQWYEAEKNDLFLDAMFPGVDVLRVRQRVFGGGAWEWRIGDYATNALVTQMAPSSVHTLYSRGDGLHGFLRMDVPLSFSVSVDFDPDTLNKHSRGRWVTVYLETPQGCDPRDIDPSTVLMNGVLSPVLDPQYGWVHSEDSYIMDHDEDGLEERMLKFDRERVDDILPLGSTIWVNITGSTYSGIEFSGSDVIRVIDLNLPFQVNAELFPDRMGNSLLDKWFSLGGARSQG